MSKKSKIKKLIILTSHMGNIKKFDNFKMAFNYLRFKVLKLYIRNFTIDENMLREILNLFQESDQNRWDMYETIRKIKRIVFELYRIQRRRILASLV